MRLSSIVVLAAGVLSVVGVASAQSHQLMQVNGSYTCEPTDCDAADAECVYARRSDGSPQEMGTCAALIDDALICRYNEGHDYETYCCTDPMGGECPGSTTCVMLADAPFGICIGPDTKVRFCADPPTLLEVALCRDLPWQGYDWSHGDCDNDQIYNQEEMGDALCDGPGYCGCWADVESDPTIGYVVDDADVGFVEACLSGEREDGCDAADVNCNGQIDYCDLAAVEAATGKEEADPRICGMVRCGGCEIDGRCVPAPPNDCAALMGIQYDRDRTCGGLPPWLPGTPPPEDAGPPADGSFDASVGSPPDVPSFRGVGGCTCGVAGGRPPAGEALLLLLFALRRTRRRSLRR